MWVPEGRELKQPHTHTTEGLNYTPASPRTFQKLAKLAPDWQTFHLQCKGAGAGWCVVPPLQVGALSLLLQRALAGRPARLPK